MLHRELEVIKQIFKANNVTLIVSDIIDYPPLLFLTLLTLDYNSPLSPKLAMLSHLYYCTLLALEWMKQ